MKRSCLVALALALGISATAAAANPFSDVPAGHWAYDSVARLAAAGVVDGYGDGTFGGEKLMTRYEMAQIVAKAMAKGANVDKLAAEFADELDALGVRVSNLEKKSDNVKIAGEIRAHYASAHRGFYGDDGTKSFESALRTRLWVSGQVNDDWSYTGMIENVQDLADNTGNEKTAVKEAYVSGKLGGVEVQAGRWNEVVGTGNVYDGWQDALKLSYGDKLKITGMVGKGVGEDEAEWDSYNVKFYQAGVSGELGPVNLSFNYFKADFDKQESNRDIYNLTAEWEFIPDLTLTYDYMWADKKYNPEVSKDGWVAALSYKGADGEEPGSWGVHVQYFDQPENAYLCPTTDAWTDGDGGYKGWNIGADLALAKNITVAVNYYDTEAKVGDEDNRVLFSELYFNF